MSSVIDLAGSLIGAIVNLPIYITLKVADMFFGKPDQPSIAPTDLKDRTTTITDSDAPHVYVYGRARVGSAIVAALTSGARDEYKHIVCIHAAHECDAFEEVWINKRALGTLDSNGYVTTGDYFSTGRAAQIEYVSGTGITLLHTPIAGTLRIFYACGDAENPVTCEQLTYTLTGNVISGMTSLDYTINYEYDTSVAYVRVLKHLGAIDQVADATLISELPTKWDATKKLSGMCYTIVTLNLNYPDFQQGCPEIEVLLRGKKLHDVRDVSYPNDTAVWSENPALVIADYLTSEMCAVPWTDLPLADFIAAANVCDENITTPVNIGARYTCNGTITSDDTQPDMLEKLAQAMAGTITATTWGVTAGKYIAPVMSLSQSDIVGNLTYNSGLSEADLFNGVKGRYINSLNLYVPTDFAPYQNTSYQTADGAELWNDIDFMFTTTKQRIHNLCRIYTEDQRNGFSITADFSYKAWALKIGDRVSFTSSFLGQTSKIYRVMQKSYGGESAIKLTLKEDAESIWDFLDEVQEDATPNTDLPNPFIVGIPGNIQVAEELYETTGSSGVKVKAVVTWDAPADINVLDYEITYKSYFDADYTKTIFSLSESVEILDVADGQYDLKIRARNHLYIKSEYTPVKTFTIYGLVSAPGNVTGLTIKPFNGSAICSWDKTVDLDVKIGGDVEIRFCPLTTGASWEQSFIIPDGQFNGDATSAIVSLATGTYYAKFKDSTGHYSATEASFVLTEALMTGWTTVTTTTQDPTFTGSKTSVFVDNNALKLGGTTLWDDMPLMDSWGEIDYMGGVASTGTYLFDATVDLTTVASRRFHIIMQALSVSVSDTIDARLSNIDTWESFDGDSINGTDATVYASVSDDDITYSAWVPFMVADFSCRYAKFKAILSSNDPNQNIELHQLRVAIKIPA